MNINGWLEVEIGGGRTLVRAYGTIISLYITFTNDKKLQSKQKREKGRKKQERNDIFYRFHKLKVVFLTGGSNLTLCVVAGALHKELLVVFSNFGLVFSLLLEITILVL